MAHGGKRKGAGRKSKAEEIQLAESMDNILSVPDVLQNLGRLVRDNDLQAIKLWLEYRLGKPQQSVDLTTNGKDLNIPPMQWVATPDKD